MIDRIDVTVPSSKIYISALSADGKVASTADYDTWISRANVISNFVFQAAQDSVVRDNLTWRKVDANVAGVTQTNPSGANELRTLNANGNLTSGVNKDGQILIWAYKDNEWHDVANLGGGVISAFNALGNIAVGNGNYYDSQIPTVWKIKYYDEYDDDFGYGYNYSSYRLTEDNVLGRAYALDKTGNIAGGYIRQSEKTTNSNGENYTRKYNSATLWTGENWRNVVDLGKSLINENNYNQHDDSEIQAISADSLVVGGIIDNKPALWFGTNWKNHLLLTNELGEIFNGRVYALSENGAIAGGNSGSTPYIWSGENWNTATPLVPDNTYTGQVRALSADGSVAGGYIIDPDGHNNGALWRISYSEIPDSASIQESLPEFTGEIPPVSEVPNVEPPQEALPEGIVSPEPTGEIPPVSEVPNVAPPQEALPEGIVSSEPPVVTPPTHPSVVAMIDVANTQKAMTQMGKDTFELFGLQLYALRRLQEYCVANKGELCYAAQHSYNAQNGNYDRALGLRLGYGFTENFTFGVNYDRTLKRSLPDTYHRINSNGGVGLFVHYKLPKNSYIEAGIARDYYAAQAQRPLLENTEFAPTRTKIKGFSWNVELGQAATFSNDAKLGWYAVYRQSNIKRDGYRENIPGFPVEYGTAKLKDRAVAVGVRFNQPINEKWTWLNAAEINRSLGNQSPIYTAKSDYVGDFSYQQPINKTRWMAQTGLHYAFAPSFNVSFTPYVGNGIVGNKQWGTKLTIEGKF